MSNLSFEEERKKVLKKENIRVNKKLRNILKKLRDEISISRYYKLKNLRSGRLSNLDTIRELRCSGDYYPCELCYTLTDCCKIHDRDIDGCIVFVCDNCNNKVASLEKEYIDA